MFFCYVLFSLRAGVAALSVTQDKFPHLFVRSSVFLEQGDHAAQGAQFRRIFLHPLLMALAKP